ncbi:MAG: FtsX-like permease family protein [Chloroflexota bacterium]
MLTPYPRWRKVVRDIWGNKTRTMLVVLSIAAGIFAIGTINTTQIILANDLNAVYATIDPPSAIIGVSPFREDVLDAVRAMPEVKDADARRTISVRVKTGNNEWNDMALYAVRDYRDIRVDKILPQVGAWPPPDKQMLIERQSLALINAHIGDTVTIELPDGKRRTLPIVGSTHHLLLAPAKFTGIAYAYINMDTLEWLGATREFTSINFIVKENDRDKAHIERVAEKVRRKIENSGRTVFTTFVPTPGKHPASDALEPLLLVLSALSYMTLLMSGFLVINTVNALLGQQLKQIGIMKSIGALSRQLIGIYIVMIIVFGLLALAIAIPLGALGAYGLTHYVGGLVNFEIISSSIQPQVLALQFIFGLLVPFVAALIPIISGVTVSVREAIYSETQAAGFGTGLVDQILHRVRGLPAPLLLALRNSVRAKARLALTLTTLIIGGAAFIGVYSVRASLLQTLDNAIQYRDYDAEIRFSRPYRLEAVTQVAENVKGVAWVEGWGFSVGRRIRDDDTESGSIQIFAPPADTRMIKPMILNGRWLLPDDANAVVINTDLLRDETDLKVGDEITLKINSKEKTYRVVGITRGILAGAYAYINYPYYSSQVAGESGRVGILQIRFKGTDANVHAQLTQTLESTFKADYSVSSIRPTPNAVRSVREQFNILIVFLFIMAAIVGVVSALGLSGAMSMNVLERTREIGVMRSLGASDMSVLMVFLLEGIFIGVASWIGGSIFAYPLSVILSNQVGDSLVRAPLLYTFPPEGVALWLFGSIALATIATFAPAHRASMLSVREVLAYE